MEYVIVVFPFSKLVSVDDVVAGNTNEAIALDAGTHKFNLGSPVDYAPAFQTVTVANTSILQPLKIFFSLIKGAQ